MVKRVVHSSSIRPPPIDSTAPHRLLLALALEDYQRILPDPTMVPTTVKPVPHKHGAAVPTCIFRTVMSDGSMVEGATIGDEGALTPSLTQTSRRACPSRRWVTGSAVHMTVAAFRRKVGKNGVFQEVVSRYQKRTWIQQTFRLSLLLAAPASSALNVRTPSHG